MQLITPMQHAKYIIAPLDLNSIEIHKFQMFVKVRQVQQLRRRIGRTGSRSWRFHFTQFTEKYFPWQDPFKFNFFFFTEPQLELYKKGTIISVPLTFSPHSYKSANVCRNNAILQFNYLNYQYKRIHFLSKLWCRCYNILS